jgi:hypothetical protein
MMINLGPGLFENLIWKFREVAASIFLACAAAGAEVGVSYQPMFNLRADFSMPLDSYGFNNDPGAAAGGTDHFYDNGYNRVDSAGNIHGPVNNVSWYWGSGIVMSSAGAQLFEGGHSTVSENPRHGFGVFWQELITHRKQWNVGIKVSGGYQGLDITDGVDLSYSNVTIQDTYAYSIIPPAAPYAGSFTGPGPLISDTPSRNTLASAPISTTGRRRVNGYLVSAGTGPYVRAILASGLFLDLGAGINLAWVATEFSYDDGSLGKGNSRSDDLIPGMYSELDLQYRIHEQWNLVCSAKYLFMDSYQHVSDNREAELNFADAFILGFGISYN